MDRPSPASAPPPRPRRVGRRSFLLGGAGVLAGAGGGFAIGYEAGGGTRPVEAPGGSELDHERREATRVSYAQFGEDLVLNSLFATLRIAKPSYLDIGAFEPLRDNNTYFFYEHGGRGVLVEPNPDLTEKLRRLRPGDTVLAAGIGVDDRPEADYYVFDAPPLNTFDKDQVAHVERTTSHRLLRVVKVPLLSINRVIAEHFGGAAPDLISIDIEGLDYAVLKTLDFGRFRPKLVCAETVILGTLRHNPDTPRLMAENGYELRGMTHANTIFMDKALLTK